MNTLLLALAIMCNAQTTLTNAEIVQAKQKECVAKYLKCYINEYNGMKGHIKCLVQKDKK